MGEVNASLDFLEKGGKDCFVRTVANDQHLGWCLIFVQHSWVILVHSEFCTILEGSYKVLERIPLLNQLRHLLVKVSSSYELLRIVCILLVRLDFY